MSLFKKNIVISTNVEKNNQPQQNTGSSQWIAKTINTKGVRNTNQTYTSVSRRHIFDATEMTEKGFRTRPGTPSRYNKRVLKAELASIAAISFVPDGETRDKIYLVAEAAKTNKELCSKTTEPEKIKLPSESVLVKIALGQPLPWARDGMPLPAIRDGKFAILNDAFPPLLPSVHRSGALKGSNGPNGVLTYFGDNQRINLFYQDNRTTKKLLDEYLAFRNLHKADIFEQTLVQMEAGAVEAAASAAALTADTLDEVAVKEAAASAAADYDTTVKILRQIQKSNFVDNMIGVVSFCQTWATREGAGGPQFSVESPHFQTRFFIKSLNYDLTMTKEESAAYVRTVKAFDERMAELDYTGKFVHLDKLQQQLSA
jgi:hypothetical protein